MLRISNKIIIHSIFIGALYFVNNTNGQDEFLVTLTKKNLGSISMLSKSSEPVIQYNLLFLGNSHTRNHNVPELIKQMIKAAEPNAIVDYSIAPGIMFLDQRLHDSRTRKLFDKKQFTQVILQAQKYSQSRRKYYSTKASEQWVKMIHKKSAIAILFPEWGQRGRQWEGEYVHDIYAGIANRTAACIAPVGLAWDNAVAQKRLRMHAGDGNHANQTGAFLTALILFETITRMSVEQLPRMDMIDVAPETQIFLRKVAAKTLKNFVFCKKDNLL